MPDQPNSPKEAFIHSDLRPDLTPTEEHSPLAPNAANWQFRQQAAELLGPDLLAHLGVGDAAGAPLEAARVYSRKPDIVWSAIDGEAVLLDLASGYYFSLNHVGAAIWEMLDGERTLGSIHDAVCNRFDVDPATAWEDLASLVRRLSGEKLITAGGSL